MALKDRFDETALPQAIESDDYLFYTPGNVYADYVDARLAELQNAEMALKNEDTGEYFSYADIVSSAPYQTDIKFQPQGREEQYYPSPLDRFLQLDFINNVTDDTVQNEFINRIREKLKQDKNYVDTEGNLDTDKLQSLGNAAQYNAFAEYVSKNVRLEGVPYDERARELSGSPLDLGTRARELASYLPATAAPLIAEGVAAAEDYLFEINEDQRKAYSARGANPDKSYLTILREQGITLPDGTLAVDDLVKGRSLSPGSLTARELENLLSRFDKTAEVQPLDYQNPEGTDFIVTSELTGGRPKAFGNIQPLETAFAGSPEELIDELDVFLRQETPKLILGMGGVGLVRRGIKTAAEKQAQRNAEKISEGRSSLEQRTKLGTLAQIAGYAGVSGIGEGLGQAAILYNGKYSGYQPDIAAERIWETSGLAAIYAFGGEAVGELALKLFGKISNMFTGERIPETILARLRAASAYIRNKSGVTLDDLAEGSPELSVETMNDFVTRQGFEVGQQLKTLGDITQDDVLQAMEFNLIQAADPDSISGGLPVDSPARGMLEAILSNQDQSLDKYYEALKRGLGPDIDFDRPQFNDLVNRIRLEGQEQRRVQFENNLVETEGALDIEQQFPGVLDPEAGGSQELGESLQNIVKGGRPSYPEYSSELMNLYRQYTDPIREKYGEVFKRTDINLETGESFATYQEPVVPLPKFIGDALNDMLYADKPEGRIFGTSDKKEVAEIIRTILPNREQEGISIELLADPPKFLKQREFSIEEITRTMDDLEKMFSANPNPEVREAGAKLLQGLADARSEAYRIQYRKITGAKRTPTEAKAAQKFEDDVLSTVGGDINTIQREIQDELAEVDGRYIYSLATKEPTELGKFILDSKPSKIDGVIRVLTQTPEGLQKLQTMKQIVFNEIDQQILGDAPSAVEQARRFTRLSSRRKEQLARLFPEVELNPANFRKIEIQLKENQKNLDEVNKIISNMVDPATGRFLDNPIKVLDDYFKLDADGKRAFRGTEAYDKLLALSDIANKYPDLRLAFRGELLRRMKDLAGIDKDQARGLIYKNVGDRENSNFDLDRLVNFSLAYRTTGDLAKDLELFVGKDLARDYAMNLRNFTRRVRSFANKGPGKKKKEGQLQTIMDAVGATVTRIRRGAFGLLSRAGYRTQLVLDALGPKVAEDLATILANPAKLDEFMKIYDKKRLPLGDIPRAITQIAMGRYGAEKQETTEVEQFRQRIREDFNLDDTVVPFKRPRSPLDLIIE